ncbi:hypothetical protein BOBR111200_14285 [Bordetella bronchialis]
MNVQPPDLAPTFIAPHPEPITTGLLPSVPPRQYGIQAGDRKATLRFAPARRGGAARQVMDGNAGAGLRHAAANGAMLTRPMRDLLQGLKPMHPPAPALGAPVALRPGVDVVHPRPQSAPALLESAVGDIRPGTLPERAVRQDDMAPMPAPVPDTGGCAAPLRRGVASLVGAIGLACDAVYQGVNAAGRKCRDVYRFIHDKCTSVGRKSSDTPVALLIADVARLMRNQEVLDALGRIAQPGMTYQKLRYMAEQRGFRIAEDAAGRGFDAPLGTTSDSLTRRLVSSLQNSDDPWRILRGHAGLQDTCPELAIARERYLAYRDAHYPDFDAIHRRMQQFSDLRPLEEMKALVESRRAASEANGDVFDADAYIQDNILNPGNPYPITGRQLRDDVLRLQKCMPDLAGFLQGLDLADCRAEYRRRQREPGATGSPAQAAGIGMQES